LRVRQDVGRWVRVGRRKTWFFWFGRWEIWQIWIGRWIRNRLFRTWRERARLFRAWWKAGIAGDDVDAIGHVRSIAVYPCTDASGGCWRMDMEIM